MLCIVIDEENLSVLLETDAHVAISIETHCTSLVCCVVHKTEGRIIILGVTSSNITRMQRTAIYSITTILGCVVCEGKRQILTV